MENIPATTNKPYHFFYSSRDSFSNFYDAPFEYQGIQFSCSEQFFMYLKAKLFHDSFHASQILGAKTPVIMKRHGRLIPYFDPKIWDEYKQYVMYIALREKVNQHDDIKSKLLNTAPKIIVEASPMDKIWGVGLSHSNPLIQDSRNWQGQNLLGYLWTRLREDIIHGTSFVTTVMEERIQQIMATN